MIVQLIMKIKVTCSIMIYVQLSAANSDLIIMGDFNRSGINWVTMKSDWRGKRLFELSQDLFLTQG